MYPILQSINLRKIVTIFLSILAVFGIWYIVTHGRLVLPGITNETVAMYSQLSQGANKPTATTASESNFIASGLYSVSVSDKDGNRSISTIDVPRFLFSASAKPATKPTKVSTIARNSLPNIIETQAGLSSYEGTAFRLLDPSNITNDNLKDFELSSLPNFVESKQIDKQTLVGYEVSEAGIQPVRHSVPNDTDIYYPLISDAKPEDIGIQVTGQTFSIFNKKDSVVYIYDQASTNTITLSVKNAGKVSRNEGIPVFSATNKFIAVSIGPDYVASNDTADDLEGGGHDIAIFDITTKKKIHTIKVSSAPVLSAALSPNGKYIAVSTDTQTAIYDIASGKYTFSIPHSVEQFQWYSDDKFVFITRTEGVFSGSAATRSAQSVIPYSQVRPTSMSYVENNELYFTGYSEAISNAEFPDAYKAQLAESADNNSIAGVRHFPEQGRGYYVDYLNGTVTVQLTRYDSGEGGVVDESVKSDAIAYITKHLPGYDTNNIRYVYVDLVF